MLPQRRPDQGQRGLLRQRHGLPLRATSPPEPRRSARDVLLRSWPGRIFLVAVAAKLVVIAIRPLTTLGGLLDVVGTAATLALAFAVSYFVIRLIVLIKRRLLWRVRRKLILSYIFIGVVPALLIVAFFLLAGQLLFLNISAYLLKKGVADLVDQAQTIAQTAAAEIQRGNPAGAREILERKRANMASRMPGLSLALVRVPPSLEDGPPADVPARGVRPIPIGPWRHLDPPSDLPAWVSRSGFGGLIAFPSENDEPLLVIRAAGMPDGKDPAFAVIADLPVDDPVRATIQDDTGMKIDAVTLMFASETGAGEPRSRRDRLSAESQRMRDGLGENATLSVFRKSVTFFEYRDWVTGRTGWLSVQSNVSVADIYKRLSAAQSISTKLRLADLFLVMLVVIAALFLIIEVVALVMGFVLAKSVTGSVHELFMGTERVRDGDFTHRIDIKTKDQFGELADSFNAMTASIEDLLVQAAEKKRLEEELRIAREIQMSLLPRGQLLMPGLAVTALCVPAREVGGDYYDFFPLSDRRLGILIADVSGKGTSAALYMAELKGLVLSLSEIYQSPKRLLIEANRIISENLDSRSFITMTYAMLDLNERTLTYARAGHTPLIYLPGPGAPDPRARILTPDGMVLGLRIDGIAERFETLLEECTVPLTSGDVFVFFTDGITEAMNSDSDLFGEDRLSTLIQEHGHLPSEELRERILRDVEAFVAGADQHDDMTMILMKIDDFGAEPPRAAKPEDTSLVIDVVPQAVD